MEAVEIIAYEWNLKLKEDMTSEDWTVLNSECSKAGISLLDVMSFIECNLD